MSLRLLYRWAVFLLAAGYAVRMVLFSDYDAFGGPFRFLTIWALFMSYFAASRMIALEEGRTERRWDAFVSATAVMNAMVVLLYWRLFFNDPASVTRNGELGEWWLEFYLHGLGPLLQWIDALFIHRAFRRIGAGLATLFGVVFTWICLAEFVIQPLSDTPTGTVTNGLPYPFLNSMEVSERLVFYGANFAVAVVFFAGFAALAWVIRRFLPKAAP